MRSSVAVTGGDLNSCTPEVTAFGCRHPNGSGRKVVIVDTPGFDDSEGMDYQILKAIAQWLEQT
jgi:predicted GTPase